jgi:hypothetical protein
LFREKTLRVYPDELASLLGIFRRSPVVGRGQEGAAGDDPLDRSNPSSLLNDVGGPSGGATRTTIATPTRVALVQPRAEVATEVTLPGRQTLSPDFPPDGMSG